MPQTSTPTPTNDQLRDLLRMALQTIRPLSPSQAALDRIRAAAAR